MDGHRFRGPAGAERCLGDGGQTRQPARAEQPCQRALEQGRRHLAIQGHLDRATEARRRRAAGPAALPCRRQLGFRPQRRRAGPGRTQVQGQLRRRLRAKDSLPRGWARRRRPGLAPSVLRAQLLRPRRRRFQQDALALCPRRHGHRRGVGQEHPGRAQRQARHRLPRLPHRVGRPRPAARSLVGQLVDAAPPGQAG